MNKKTKKYHRDNKERSKAYRESHKEKTLNTGRAWAIKNKEKLQRYRARYYVENKAKLEANKRYKYNNDIPLRAIHNLSQRMRKACVAQNTISAIHTEKELGCTKEYFTTHIESLFVEGMSWDNYGYYGWHIDHIKGCSTFDLRDPKQRAACFNYRNTRPLWAQDNFKRNKIV